MRRGRPLDREIDLRRVQVRPDDEVLELDPAAPFEPPAWRLLGLLAGLAEPREAEYARPGGDPTSLAPLWRAAESL